MVFKISRTAKKVPPPPSSLRVGHPCRINFTKFGWSDKTAKVKAKRPTVGGFTGMEVELYKFTGTETAEVMCLFALQLQEEIILPQGDNPNWDA